MRIDSPEILRALAVILAPGQVTELRLLEATTSSYGRPRTIAGFFNDPSKLVAALAGISSAKGAYIVLNPVLPALLARACNRLKDLGKSSGTSDSNIVRRRWLMIDADPVRPADISSSDAEHEAALDRVYTVARFMSESGWPSPIIADSGNGGHLLYRVDLPRDDGGTVERCLQSVAAAHSDRWVQIDTTVFNAARIWKLYGTLACKGDSTPDRPHRLAKILEIPDTLEVVK